MNPGSVTSVLLDRLVHLFMVCKVGLVMSLISYGGCESSISSKTVGAVFQCIVSDQLMLIIVLNNFS